MPSKKTYEYDYEWNGEENKQKGVVIQEKNPWNKPNWGNLSKPVSTSPSKSSFAAEPERFGMEELQRRHQWTTPDWATVKGKKQPSEEKEILRDPIPKPMLKKTAAGTAAGIQGATGGPNSAAEAEIAAMEQKIEQAKQKKAALEQQQQQQVAEAEAERTRNKVEESKLEKARRLNKEREDVRWRATLAERNERDKALREQARLAALKAGSNQPASSDAVWNTAHSEQQQRYEERVQQEAAKRMEVERGAAIALIRNETTSVESSPFATQGVAHNNDDEDEYEEEEVLDEDENSVEGNDIYGGVSTAADSTHPDELQGQIDALRLELEAL